TNVFQTLANAMLEALVGRLVVGAPGEVVRQAPHVRNFLVEIVRVFVALTVADIFHQAGNRVAQVERNWVGLGFVNVFHNLAVGSVEGVGLGRERKIYGSLGQRKIAFRRSDEIEGFLGGERYGEGAGFGEADVLA